MTLGATWLASRSHAELCLLVVMALVPFRWVSPPPAAAEEEEEEEEQVAAGAVKLSLLLMLLQASVLALALVLVPCLLQKFSPPQRARRLSLHLPKAALAQLQGAPPRAGFSPVRWPPRWTLRLSRARQDQPRGRRPSAT